jgi:hypothetical protein
LLFLDGTDFDFSRFHCALTELLWRFYLRVLILSDVHNRVEEALMKKITLILLLLCCGGVSLRAQPGQPQVFRDQVWFTHSVDGLHWGAATLLAEKASVPEVIRTSTGVYWAYWVDFTSASGPRAEKIGLARSPDGKNWEKLGQVQFSNLGTIVPVDPDVIELADGRLRLYFFDIARDRNRGMNPIHSAISNDGVHYTIEPDVRFELPQILDPDVIKLPDGRYRMYLNNNGKIISATSQDGLSFSQDNGIRVFVEGSVPGSIVLPDGSVRLYACDRGISAFRSPDGLSFSLERSSIIQAEPGGPPVILCDPSVTATPTGYLMVYKFNPGR